MRLLRSVLPIAYPLLLARKVLCRAIASTAKADLRVLLYHDVAPDNFATFSNQLKWLMQRWHFLSPAEFAAIIDGEAELHHDSLLLTFDDGFASNRQIAEQILQPLGIRALFFAVSEFIDQPDAPAARAFICDRLKAGNHPNTLPPHYTNMSWDDLRALIALGHEIGAHTASHERLTGTVALKTMRREIIGGADRLEVELNTQIRHFAFPFGDFSSFSLEAMQIAAARFDYVYSGLRGNNHPNPSRYALRRDSQTPTDSKALLGSFLGGASDFRYRNSNAVLDKWGRQAATTEVPDDLPPSPATGGRHL